nr:hypothetical protein [Tanacetum cinerariifolium]
VRILALDLILAFPLELRSSSRVLTDLDNGNAALLELLHLAIHDLHRFFNKMQLVIKLNHLKRDDKTLIR